MARGVFPFGEPVRPVVQTDRRPKSIFVLGVYASAVHARWVGPDGRTRVAALAVASEPEIFWRGEGAAEIVAQIAIPPEAGRLVPAGATLNGPSGKALDDLYLSPLGRTRDDAWLSDLVPHAGRNPAQARAITRAYDPLIEPLGLPPATFPPPPKTFADAARCDAIVSEIDASDAAIILLLGDQPIRFFAHRFDRRWRRLSDFGDTPETYGRLHETTLGGRTRFWLPLAHPRQAGALGTHSERWRALHQHWIEAVAPGLLD